MMPLLETRIGLATPVTQTFFHHQMESLGRLINWLARRRHRSGGLYQAHDLYVSICWSLLRRASKTQQLQVSYQISRFQHLITEADAWAPGDMPLFDHQALWYTTKLIRIRVCFWNIAHSACSAFVTAFHIARLSRFRQRSPQNSRRHTWILCCDPCQIR